MTVGAPPIAVNSNVKVASLNSDLLDGLDSSALQNRVSSSCSVGQAIRTVNVNGTVVCEPVGSAGTWGLTGSSGTAPGTNFLGTSDNRALELKVNGQRAFRIEPTTVTPNMIGGYLGNSTGLGLTHAVGATIAGGGESGGANLVTGNFGSVGGGNGNTVSAAESTVGGGLDNKASGGSSTVGGGQNNTASGVGSSVTGGNGNTASGELSTVAGGVDDTADGDGSFAAGTQAKATLNGSFVWGDRQFVDVTSPTANSFTVRASGGVWLGTTSSPSIPSGRFINTSTGGYLSSAGTWTNNSDRAKKDGFRLIDTGNVLDKVARMPITNWSYRAEKPSVRHIGPMAQDFYSAFGLGLDNEHITTIDEGGVALAAIQGLYRQNRALERQNRGLRARLEAQDARLARLERFVSSPSR